MSEELFVQQLFNDFGEAGDAAVFEMHSIEVEGDSAPEEFDGAQGEPATHGVSDSDLKTPSKFVSQDPRMSDPRISADLGQEVRCLDVDLMRVRQERSDSLTDIAQQME